MKNRKKEGQMHDQNYTIPPMHPPFEPVPGGFFA